MEAILEAAGAESEALKHCYRESVSVMSYVRENQTRTETEENTNPPKKAREYATKKLKPKIKRIFSGQIDTKTDKFWNEILDLKSRTEFKIEIAVPHPQRVEMRKN